MLATIKKFLAQVNGSKPGILVPEELYRSILTALSSGTAIGCVILILQAVLDHVGLIFPNPAVASLASVSLTLVLDLLRRQSHGITPADPAGVNPAPASAPTA